ncbi:autotransporter outer membrane beta-barrel domain-containing protein [Bartonella sp. A05]|uniref:autotransporter outer membrane beta-barrel domain-containing protein n=1 Tax=Bartonella sp. A05 TaxID=2967261 RepID=UPI002E77AD12|nr:autotransporter outer membrane beta-barrel domain-containing protein [Bartonella sp. A05]
MRHLYQFLSDGINTKIPHTTTSHYQCNRGEEAEQCVQVMLSGNKITITTRQPPSFLETIDSMTLGENMKILRVHKPDGNIDSEDGYSVGEDNITIFRDRAIIIVKGESLKNYTISGKDRVYVSGNNYVSSNNLVVGHSIANTVKDGGELHIHGGGEGRETVIKGGGYEIVEASNEEQGFSRETVIHVGGEQRVENGGLVDKVQIHGGVQRVFGAGVVWGEGISSKAYNTVIDGENGRVGQQIVYNDGEAWYTQVRERGIQIVGKEEAADRGGYVIDTTISGGGKQYVLNGGTAFNVTLNENAIQGISAGGYVLNLMINDQASSLIQAGAILEGKTIVNGFGKVYLNAGDNQHKTTLEEVILNGKDAKLYFVATERGEGKSSLIKNLSGDGSVIFTSIGSIPYDSQLHIEDLSGNLNFIFNTAMVDNHDHYLSIDNGAGHHTISVADSGVEIKNPFSQRRNLIIDKRKAAYFTLIDLSGRMIDAVDGGAYVYGLKERTDENGRIWYLAAELVQQPNHKGSAFVTSPSTDAVLSMAVVPGLVFNNELHNLRSGRGILDRNRKNTALWTYAIKGQERIATGHTHFKLDQTGIMLGVDRLSELTNGEFYLGGFGGYDKARIAHKRGGVSNMDVYSMGAYATYFDNRGWYLDGVLKYNHYQNNLKAVSTNGLGFQGDYKQWAIGTLFEAGYRFQMNRDTWAQPYGQLTWSQVEGQKVKLSNDMIGNGDAFISLRNEFGLSVGHEFDLGRDASLMTYVTAAWLHEYIDTNRTTINKQHQFTTDLSGNAGKIGIGLNSSISNNLTFYGEAHYLKGQKREHSLQGNLGIRYRF